MTDTVDSRTRSRMMAGIGPKDTVPELAVRRMLHRNGFRYRLHQRKLPGRPDVVLAAYGVAIFVHGCFWHCHPGCRYAKTPSSNRRFWTKKLSGNAERDARNVCKLREAGWRVLVVWECAVRGRDRMQVEHLAERIAVWIRSKRQSGQFPRAISLGRRSPDR